MTRTGRIWTVAAISALVIAGVWIALRRTDAPDQRSARVESRYALATRPLNRLAVGDVDHGRQLYVMHCAPCHGLSGDGHGPAADYLWPLPRDHRDAAYMLSRSNDQLFKAVAHGGRGVSRSYLMPAWNDAFDRFQTWNLVAFIRTLTPELPAEVSRASYREILLSPDHHSRVASSGVQRPTGVLRLLGERTSADGESIEEFELGSMIFFDLPLEDSSTRLAVAYSPDGRLMRAESLRQIRIVGAPVDAVDRFIEMAAANQSPALACDPTLGDRLLRTLEHARGLMKLLLDQERSDTNAADALGQRYREQPGTLSNGERLYIQNCGACHGYTGRVVGPMVMERDAWPRVLADGTVMARLSNEYLRSLIRTGGLHWNLSGVMPANPGLNDDEINAIVAHVRSLSEPRSDGRCPCSVLAASCSPDEAALACGCRHAAGARGLCKNMKR